MKECPNCGAQVDDAAAVCRYCAAQLTGGSPAHAEPFAPQPPRAPEPPPYGEPPPSQQPPRTYQQQPQTPPPQAPYTQPAGVQPPPYQASPYGQPPQGAPYGPHQGANRPPQGPPPQQPYAQQPQQPYGQPYTQQPPPPQGQAPYPNQPPYGQAPPQQQGYAPYYRKVDRMVAGLFGLLLGTFGVHKFYMGKVGLGILYLCFFWTGVPSIIGIIEGIIYLTMDDYAFREKYCRIY